MYRVISYDVRWQNVRQAGIIGLPVKEEMVAEFATITEAQKFVRDKQRLVIEYPKQFSKEKVA